VTWSRYYNRLVTGWEADRPGATIHPRGVVIGLSISLMMWVAIYWLIRFVT
jgi:hypothetical protein